MTGTSPPPPGVEFLGDRARIADAFARVAPCQPVRWSGEGIVCVPRAGDDVTRADLDAVGLPWRALAALPGWPTPASRWIAGWYHRSPGHAPAPEGVRELVSVPGEGFGTAPHPTTGLCLDLIDRAPAGDAWDLGTGAGLLAQAWAARHGGRVDAVDVDRAAVAQARAAAAAAGRAGITWHAARAEVLTPDVTDRVVIANLPPVAHRAIAPCVTGRARAVILGGFGARDRDAAISLYRHLGCLPVAEVSAGRWVAVLATAPGA